MVFVLQTSLPGGVANTRNWRKLLALCICSILCSIFICNFRIIITFIVSKSLERYTEVSDITKDFCRDNTVPAEILFPRLVTFSWLAKISPSPRNTLGKILRGTRRWVTVMKPTEGCQGEGNATWESVHLFSRISLVRSTASRDKTDNLLHLLGVAQSSIFFCANASLLFVYFYDIYPGAVVSSLSIHRRHTGFTQVEHSGEFGYLHQL